MIAKVKKSILSSSIKNAGPYCKKAMMKKARLSFKKSFLTEEYRKRSRTLIE